MIKKPRNSHIIEVQCSVKLSEDVKREKVWDEFQTKNMLHVNCPTQSIQVVSKTLRRWKSHQPRNFLRGKYKTWSLWDRRLTQFCETLNTCSCVSLQGPKRSLDNQEHTVNFADGETKAQRHSVVFPQTSSLTTNYKGLVLFMSHCAKKNAERLGEYGKGDVFFISWQSFWKSH